MQYGQPLRRDLFKVELIKYRIRCRCQLPIYGAGHIAGEIAVNLGRVFYKVDKSRARRGEGTGLGLAIARQIISDPRRVDRRQQSRAREAFYFILPK